MDADLIEITAAGIADDCLAVQTQEYTVLLVYGDFFLINSCPEALLQPDINWTTYDSLCDEFCDFDTIGVKGIPEEFIIQEIKKLQGESMDNTERKIVAIGYADDELASHMVQYNDGTAVTFRWQNKAQEQVDAIEVQGVSEKDTVPLANQDLMAYLIDDMEHLSEAEQNSILHNCREIPSSIVEKRLEMAL